MQNILQAKGKKSNLLYYTKKKREREETNISLQGFGCLLIGENEAYKELWHLHFAKNSGLQKHRGMEKTKTWPVFP